MFEELAPLKKPETAPKTPPLPSRPPSVELSAVVGRRPSPPLLRSLVEVDTLSGLGGRTAGKGGVEPPAMPSIDPEGDLGDRFNPSAENEGNEPRL